MLTLFAFGAWSAFAQQPKEDFTLFSEPAFALTHVELVDGTGVAARPDQTILIRDGRIEAIGPAAKVAIPADAKVHDLSGHSLLPGFVMMHEHMFYPAGLGNYTEMLRSFPRLYLAGGATTIRTAGSMSPFGDINLRNEIAKGAIPGPDIHVTGPFIEGPGLLFLKVKITRDPPDARALIDYWAKEGATSYKVYMNIPRATLAAVVEEAHRRKHKVTGHLCSITYREAADLGIDNLEHGFLASTDFVKDKLPDACPAQLEVMNSLAALDPDGPEATALIDHLVAKRVALTSTLTIFETLAAGGHLMAGTDPTGYGGVIAGFSNVRELELLREAGFSLPEAVRIATRNGAVFLGRDSEIGTLEIGKRADLIVFKGSVSTDPRALKDLQWTMKAGVAYDRARILAAMKGKIGLY